MTRTHESRITELESIVAAKIPNAVLYYKCARVELIQKIVCDEFHIRRSLMLSGRRLQSIVWPRHIAMALSYELTGLGTPRLAKEFHVKDHSTILRAMEKMQDEVLCNKGKAAQVEVIRERVGRALRTETT